MKAAILKEANKNLLIEDVATPEVDNNELLIKVVACGVCHTDLHYIDHGVKTFQPMPIILGHEASGLVEKSTSTKFQKGDRVLIPSVLTCGKCEFCLSNRKNLCKNMIMPGNSINGAYAEYIKVPARDIIKLPDEIPLENACIISDAISTPYHAVVNRAKVAQDDTVLVIGCGGIGINIVQIASIMGATVIACDINSFKLKIAQELGAKYVINTNTTDIKAFLKEHNLTVNTAFEAIGNHQTIEQGYKNLSVGGKLCIVGYTNEKITINPAKIMFYEQEIIGSIGCSPDDYVEIINLVKNKKIKLDKLISNKFLLKNINNAFDELRQGSVLRNIIMPNGRGQDPLFN